MGARLIPIIFIRRRYIIMNTLLRRAAVVGCGSISGNHGRAIEAMEGVELVACADIKFDRAETFAKTFGGKPYETLEAMLDAEQIDVLHICTPHYLHPVMIELALSKGLHVFSEKPPVITGEALDRLQSLDGIDKVGVCFQNRWNPATVRVKAVLASGELGKPLGIRAFVTWNRGASYYTDSGWRGQISTEGGGVLVNQSIHTLDLMLQFMGTPDLSEAIYTNFHLKDIIEVEDTIAAHMQFGDAKGLFYATTAYSTDSPVIIEINCEKGSVRIDGTDVGIQKNGEWAFEKMEEPATGAKGYWGNGHLRCIEDYYKCMNAGVAFDSSFMSAVPTMACMLKLLDR